jgi:hypothetical protein
MSGPTKDEPASKPGWTVVISGNPGTFRLAADKRLTWFERQFGRYTYYMVYTAPHTIELTFPLQSQQTTFKFRATVKAQAQVLQPVALIDLGIYDCAEHFQRGIEHALEKNMRTHDYKDPRSAQEAGNVALEEFAKRTQQATSPIRLSEISLLLDPDEDAHDSLRALEGTGLERALAKVREEDRQAAVRKWAEAMDSMETLLANMMTCTPEDRKTLSEVVGIKLGRDAELIQHKIAAFRFALDSGKYEEHDIPEGLRTMLKEIGDAYGGKSPLGGLLSHHDSEADEAEKPNEAPKRKKPKSPPADG